ncbi:N-acetyl-alpha-D-glucosaminyl L-malate deacetylase 1 [anaerobic digester metagenome]
MNVLAIGAHPDDVEIGCGGALALHARAGDRVTVCCVTDGEAGGLDREPEELAALRRGEAEAGARTLGALEPLFLGFPDGRLAYAGYRLVAALGRFIREERPALVYVHHPEDGHPDHAHLAGAVIDACRRAGAHAFTDLGPTPHRVEGVRLYEVWTPLREVAVVVDISHVVRQKAEAIRCHASQVQLVPYDEVALGLNRYRSVLLRSAIHVEAFGTATTTW